MKRLLALACLAASLIAGAPAWARSEAPPPQAVRTVEGISEYRLANGLQVLLVPDSAKPTTTVNLTYRVGSRHESYGETGMAHLLEHLMFKGSPRHPEVWAEFTRRGLRANGTTSYDRTNYFASFAADDDNLKWYLEWQADAMVNSFIAKKDLDSEMTVVRNEMERGENDPQRVMWQRAMATLFQWHNYGKPTIGARSDVENVDIGRLQAFYRTYYQPDNATLIVAGRFDTARVLGWVQQAFGAIPEPARQLPRLYTLDPAQDGERSYTVRRSGGVPLLLAAYHVPAAAHPDFAAIEAAAQILADTPSGRLHRQLVQTQRAASVWGFAWDLADPGAAMFGAQLAPGQDLEAARSALVAAIESLGREPVTADELARAKAQWLNEWNRRFTNTEQVGVALSDSIALGDWRLFFLHRDRMRALELADVQRVAARYFVPANRVVGTYVPTEQPLRAPAPERVDVAAMLEGYKGDPSHVQAEAFDPTPANIEGRVQRSTLASGMKTALLPKGSRGRAVQARLVLHFGDEKSLMGLGQVAEFVAALLDRGTARLTRQQIQDRIDELQSSVRFGGTSSTATVSITSLRERLPAVIALVGEVLREASFPDDQLEELRAQMLAAIEAQRKEPEAVIANAIARHGDPYPRGDVRHARSFDEMAADVRAVTAAQLREFHARFYGASHAEFAASGDLEVAATRAALEQAFGAWRSPAPFARVPTPLVERPATRIVIATPDKQNAVLQVRQPIAANDLDADYPRLLLANRILGQGGNSRLWRRVREKEGLSYDVGAGVDWSAHEPASTWEASAIFAPQNRARVERAFDEEVARALKDGFTRRELDEAKQGLLAARRLARSQDGVLAGLLAHNLYLGRDLSVSQRVDDAIAAATLDEVDAALRRHLRPASFVTGLAGDFKP